MFRNISSRTLRVLIGVLLILGVVAIDLQFAAHPALAIGLQLLVAALLGVAALLTRGRLWHHRSDPQR